MIDLRAHFEVRQLISRHVWALDTGQPLGRLCRTWRAGLLLAARPLRLKLLRPPVISAQFR